MYICMQDIYVPYQDYACEVMISHVTRIAWKIVVDYMWSGYCIQVTVSLAHTVYTSLRSR
jgi:hypothetical protein